MLLAGASLGISAASALAHERDPLPGGASARLQSLFGERRRGVPVAYLLGRREFYGLELEVCPDVLIPRPETELLVDLVLERAAPGAPLRILELGTGSGAVAIAIALRLPQAELTATDVSPAALEVAARNARRLGAPVAFRAGDWFEGLSCGTFDFIVSNPPYVPEADPHLASGDLRFEPALALCGGAGGLEPIRHIVAQCTTHLRPGAWLLLEHGHDQAARVRDLVSASGCFAAVQSWRDLAGHERVSGGQFQGDGGQAAGRGGQGPEGGL